MKKFSQLLKEIKLSSNKGENINNFMDEFESLSTQNPLNPKVRYFLFNENELVKIELYPFGGMIHIADIFSTHKNEGNATKALEKIIELSNKHKVNLTINAVAYKKNSEALNQRRLKMWYKNHGFQMSNDDDGMIYYAR